MSNGSSTANLSWLDSVAALNATLDGNGSAAADDETGGWPPAVEDPWDGSPYPSRYSKLSFVATAFVVTCIMILIVVGNMLVCIAIATEKTLKTIQNWFIASLAVSDFLIGLIIMPVLARQGADRLLDLRRALVRRACCTGRVNMHRLHQ
ncbi:hypothetical protein MRX96_054344 [Rhipicephalus microplus]